MFNPLVRSAPRRVLTSKLRPQPSRSRRFLSTAPPSQKSRTLKSSAARWTIAAAGIYYYNTSPHFTDDSELAITRLDDSIHHVQDSKLPTVDAIVEEKHRRQAAKLKEEEAQANKAQIVAEGSADGGVADSVGELEEEAGQQGAFNPETGEINWDCACLGGMAHGPCGPEFKEAFSCFIYSTEEPKGMECIEKFKGMQDCFREHPEIYGAELEDDEEMEEGEEVPQEQPAAVGAVAKASSEPDATSSPVAVPAPPPQEAKSTISTSIPEASSNATGL